MANQLLVLRTPSGISADMLCAGLVRVAGLSDRELDDYVAAFNVLELDDCLRVERANINGLTGWKLICNLPQCHHEHRSLADVKVLIHASKFTPGAKRIAESTYDILAQAEGAVHGVLPDAVVFHELGALESVLDVCLAAALFDRLALDGVICSPIPICDGVIRCAHGFIAAPAPVVLHMLVGIPVYGIDSSGETITPSALALLKAVGTRFEPWPAIRIDNAVRVYGGRVLPNVPNGAMVVLGSPYASTPVEHTSGLVHPIHQS